MKKQRRDYRDTLLAKGLKLGPVVLRTKKGKGHWRLVSSCLPMQEVE